ncbi:uncharacterized protein LY79DRAFT_581952 [Colletotrichum navitas]|uniref:Uncharacterized protein n=1 Tax=Colletotrichum navitas TaxID=681940 RepID=A0AAD8PT31_9PEZI|nr:uncharacterized protein LY79DRAFT_581952 [Colletotrichum navitas]KAK1580201.1 hypothetical protein LY79DRAFT_581952 [Colletotrichum navitas]
MNTVHIKRGSVRQGKYDIYWSKDNEWAIIDDEEEEENERRLKDAYHHPRLSSRYLTAGLFVVLVPAMCGLLWCCRERAVQPHSTLLSPGLRILFLGIRLLGRGDGGIRPDMSRSLGERRIG